MASHCHLLDPGWHRSGSKGTETAKYAGHKTQETNSHTDARGTYAKREVRGWNNHPPLVYLFTCTKADRWSHVTGPRRRELPIRVSLCGPEGLGEEPRDHQQVMMSGIACVPSGQMARPHAPDHCTVASGRSLWITGSRAGRRGPARGKRFRCTA
jgi:hypothetical protein